MQMWRQDDTGIRPRGGQGGGSQLGGGVVGQRMRLKKTGMEE